MVNGEHPEARRLSQDSNWQARAPLGLASPSGAGGRQNFDTLLDRPVLAVVCFAALQCLVWTLAPALTHAAPPLDVVESYLWGKEWIIGSHKHPNMPGWVLEASRQLTGAVGWPAYLASQLFVAATYACVFALGREMMGARRALAGTLLLAGVFYFMWPTIEFNHNVAQMPFWAAIAWLLWHLRSANSLFGWMILGLIGAASLYAKLSSGLLVAIGGAWILADPVLRGQLASAKPWVGLAVFLAGSAPLAFWLVQTGFAPLHYLAERATGSTDTPWQFVGGQALACVGAGILALFAGIFRRRSGKIEYYRVIPITYLAALTFAPMVVTTLLGVAAQTGVKSMWGSPMFALVGLLIVAIAPPDLPQPSLRRLAAGACLLLLVVPLGYAADTLLEARLTGHIKRQNWPQAAMASRFDQLWTTATGKPMRIVAGERWIAGLVALRSGDMPSILTDGDLTVSPWISQDRLRVQGALLVWEQRSALDKPPGNLLQLIGSRPVGLERFPVPMFPNAPPLLIGYAVLPPG